MKLAEIVSASTDNKPTVNQPIDFLDSELKSRLAKIKKLREQLGSSERKRMALEYKRQAYVNLVNLLHKWDPDNLIFRYELHTYTWVEELEKNYQNEVGQTSRTFILMLARVAGADVSKYKNELPQKLAKRKYYPEAIGYLVNQEIYLKKINR